MVYPFMTLNDQTKIAHSEPIIYDDGTEHVKALVSGRNILGKLLTIAGNSFRKTQENISCLKDSVLKCE